MNAAIRSGVSGAFETTMVESPLVKGSSEVATSRCWDGSSTPRSSSASRAVTT
ncbi:MAG: hypothetical protein R2789_10310 [Microthrixaceae bacterium]